MGREYTLGLLRVEGGVAPAGELGTPEFWRSPGLHQSVTWAELRHVPGEEKWRLGAQWKLAIL